MTTETINRFKELLRIDADFEIEDNVIGVYGSAQWGATNENDYIRQEKIIDNYERAGNGWKLNAWCDISGFNYWMIQQEESNYVSIDVVLTKDNYTDEEINEIRDAIINADVYFVMGLTDYTSEIH